MDTCRVYGPGGWTHLEAASPPPRCYGCGKLRIFGGVEQVRLERDSMGLHAACTYCQWRERLQC